MSIVEVPFEDSLGLGGVSDRILLKHATLHAGTDPVARVRATAGMNVLGRAGFTVLSWYGVLSGDVSTWDLEMVLGELERRRDARGGGVL